MSQIVPEEITYLDFEPEKEEKKRHWSDPVNNDIYWCGKRKSGSINPYSESTILADSKVTCVKCLQLAVALGKEWWWETHRKFYGSRCRPNHHDCGA